MISLSLLSKLLPFAKEAIKWGVLVAGIIGAVVILNNHAYNRGFKDAETICALTQEKEENKGTEKVIKREITVTKHVMQATDPDLRTTLDFWMRSSREENSRRPNL